MCIDSPDHDARREFVAKSELYLGNTLVEGWAEGRAEPYACATKIDGGSRELSTEVLGF